MTRVFLYPTWSLYPQIFPLEVKDDQSIGSAAAALFSIPKKFITVYDQQCQPINGDFGGGIEPDSRIGVSIKDIPFHKGMFEIGQTASTSLTFPQPPKPKLSPSPVFRKQVLMSENEHQLVRQLVPFDVSDNVERFETINLHELLPYRRPGDPRVTVVIQLATHLSSNNSGDIEKIKNTVEKIRQEASKPDKFDRFCIEIDLSLFLNTVENLEAEWLPWAKQMVDELLAQDKELRSHADIGNFNKIFVYSYDQLTVSQKHFTYRQQSIEAVTKLHYLAKNHPPITQSLNQAYRSAFSSLPGPMNNIHDGFTRQEVAFFIDPQSVIPLTARWAAAEMILENFNTAETKILLKGQAYAREILGAVGMLPRESNSLNIPVTFDAGKFYETLIREIPLKIGNIELNPEIMSKKEEFKTLQNLLLDPGTDWKGKGPGFFFTSAKNLEAASRLVTIAQVTAFRSALHHVCEALENNQQYRVLYASLDALHRLLDLVSIDGAPPNPSSGEQETGEIQPDVRKYLKEKALDQPTTCLDDKVELKRLVSKARPGFFKRVFFRRALKGAQINLINALSAEIARFLKHEAYAYVEKSLVLGSGFTAAWHLARRCKPKAESELRHIDMMVKEFQRNKQHLLVSLNQEQKQRVTDWLEALKKNISQERQIKEALETKIQEFLTRTKLKGLSQMETGFFEFIDNELLPPLKPIINKIKDKYKINLKKEIQEKIDYFLNYPGFHIGYMKRKDPALIREAYQAFHIFSPPLSDEKKKEMEEFVNHQQTNFLLASELVEVPDILETVIVMDYFFCSLDCFAPEPFWEPPEETANADTNSTTGEYL